MTRTDFKISPVHFLSANLSFAGGAERALSDDYYRLVYSATIHNKNAHYWVVLDPPVNIATVEEPVHVVELIAPEPISAVKESASYLGADFEVLAQLEVVFFDREEIAERKILFRRGDVNASGTINVTRQYVAATIKKDHSMPAIGTRMKPAPSDPSIAPTVL